jgi:hypothetical protein
VLVDLLGSYPAPKLLPPCLTGADLAVPLLALAKQSGPHRDLPYRGDRGNTTKWSPSLSPEAAPPLCPFPRLVQAHLTRPGDLASGLETLLALTRDHPDHWTGLRGHNAGATLTRALQSNVQVRACIRRKMRPSHSYCTLYCSKAEEQTSSKRH